MIFKLNKALKQINNKLVNLIIKFSKKRKLNILRNLNPPYLIDKNNNSSDNEMEIFTIINLFGL